MNNNTISILGGIFFLLLVVVSQPYWSKYIQMPTLLRQQDAEELNIPDDIYKISVNASEVEEAVVLEKVDGNWLVTGFDVDTEQINLLLEDLKSLHIDSTVSNNPDKFDTYGASDSASKLKIEGEAGTALELIVGKTAPQIGSIYIRPVGVNEVYLVQSNLHNFVDKRIEDWRDKTLIDTDQDSLVNISVKKGWQTVVLSKNENDQWLATRNGEERVVGEVALDRLFDSLSPLRATLFANQDQVKLYNRQINPVTIELIQGDDQDTQSFTMVENKTESNWLIKPSSSDEIYVLPLSVGNVLIDSSLTLFE